MADRTWQKAFLLAAVGMALAAGCTINSEDGTDDDYNDILVQMTAWVSRG